VSFAFSSHGAVTSEIDYENMEIITPEVECDEPVVKGDPLENQCLPKVITRLTYAFTKDREFNATLIFYNFFNEIVGETVIEETLRWEEDHADIVDFVYVYPEFDVNDILDCHRIKWKVRGKKQIKSKDNEK